ncbi:amidohydrolase [Hoyosella sp. YIM 151337]|uniref:amidohydrolase n=1 Tax=Hoyosella sp. YIM 151337 TaxID=2992742 RepID=UPI0022364ED0|nr:amidohydrolase [Hoyosella sp. YIM 151337]MCW4355752.1 amidohydrolase [Hoyosella sp. YIM 151337]
MDADTIIRGGNVFGAPAIREPASAIAITSGRIAAIGGDEVLELSGPRTEVIDAAGGTIMPGFQDGHVHPLESGLRRLRCDLSELPHSRDAYLQRIKAYAATHDDDWITGSGWYGDAFPGSLPTRHDLDEVVADRPAILGSHDAHGVWVNSRALQLAGITDTTPDPPGGRINRDENGSATGVLVEAAADLVAQLVPKPSAELMERALLEAQQHLHSLGVTAWQDAIIGSMWGTPDNLPTYVSVAEKEQLTARVVGALWWTPERGLAQMDELRARRMLGQFERFRATSVKIMQDGICENCTGAMLSPYLTSHGPADQRGMSFIDADELRHIAQLLDADGFQIHLHAVGDRAVRESLDALEYARTANGITDNRHQIAHVDVIHPEDVPRFAELGVIANIQALWARRDAEIVERKLPLLGKEREKWHFPFGSLARAGARLAMGSDWPVTDPNPMWALHTAVHRTAPPEDPHAVGVEALTVPLEAEQALDLRTALDAYTIGSAYANHLDTESGTIEVGKLADIVVLDQNVVATEHISAIKPTLTMVGGEVVSSR